MMKVIKALLAAFLVGGIFSVVGQGITLGWVGLLGGNNPLLGFAILVSMGIVGAVMFAMGAHQPVEKFGGFGAMLPFNGLCAAIAATYAGAKEEGLSTGTAIGKGVMLVVYVVGLGTLICSLVALVVFFMGR